MKRFWEQLKPGERRWVAGIGLALFVLLNWIFVRPHFSDWSRAETRMKKDNDLIAQYNGEIKNRRLYENKITALQSDGGSEVLDDDQAIDLVRFYESCAHSNDVQIINNSRPMTRTNDPFFVDHEMQLNVQGKEPNVVNFLFNLGTGNSVVRVRALSLRPDSLHQQINANVSIVASYAKKLPTRASDAKTRTPAAAPTKPAAPTPVAAAKPPLTNKPIVTISHNNATNKQPVPLTAKRP
jgi:hypothetical protein